MPSKIGPCLIVLQCLALGGLDCMSQGLGAGVCGCFWFCSSVWIRGVKYVCPRVLGLGFEAFWGGWEVRLITLKACLLRPRLRGMFGQCRGAQTRNS
jgi:hypothetical protein